MTNRNLRSYPGANAVLPAEAELVHELLRRGVHPNRILGYLTHSHDGGRPQYSGNLVFLERYIKEAWRDYQTHTDRTDRQRRSVAPEVEWCLEEAVSHALLSSFFSNWYATIEHGVPFVQALIIAFDQHLAQTAHFDEAALRAMRTAVRELVKARDPLAKFSGPIRSGFKSFQMEHLLWIHDRIMEGAGGRYGASMTSCSAGHDYLRWGKHDRCPKCLLAEAASVGR